MNGKKKSKDEISLLEKQQLFTEKIGKRVRELREKTGLSQERFGNQHDIDRRQLGRIESGTDILTTTLVKVLHALDISPAEFFKDFK